MPRKKQPENLDSQLDAALGGILAQGWDEPAEQPREPVPVLEPEYPPLPVREPAVAVPSPLAVTKAAPVAPAPDAPEDIPGDRGMLDIGLLTDLAAGRKTAAQAAAHAGVSEGELQSALAVALRDVPPDDIAKAMGLQAAEQQLKSGALYGAVLADLMQDMIAGRLKPETKIELAKLLARVGRVEPKEDKGAGAGGGFVLNINLGSADAKPVIIESD